MNENGRISIVYEAVNLVNGHRYIGVTVRTLSERRRGHIWSAQKTACPYPFARAIRKYGPDKFSFSVRSKWSSYEAALAEEIRLIADERPKYNATVGGEGIIILNRKEYSPEWYAKTSASMRGRKLTSEQKERLRTLNLGKFKRPVVCLHDGFWGSIRDAAKRCGGTQRGVYAAASGEQPNTRGVSFVFSANPLSEDERMALLAGKAERSKDGIEARSRARRRAVVCTTDGIEYQSGRAAAKAYGIDVMRVSQLCTRGGCTMAGLRFRFADSEAVPDKPPRTAEEVARSKTLVLAALKRGQRKVKKRVLCLDDGREFDSITAAAQAYGAHISSMSAAIIRGTRCAGRRFRYLEKQQPWHGDPTQD